MAGSDSSNPVRIGPPKYLKEVHWPDNYIALEFRVRDFVASPFDPSLNDCPVDIGPAPNGYITAEFKDISATWLPDAPGKQGSLPTGVWKAVRYEFNEFLGAKDWLPVTGGDLEFHELPDYTVGPPSQQPSPTNPVVWTNVFYPTTRYGFVSPALNSLDRFRWHTTGDGSGIADPPPVPDLSSAEGLTLSWDTSPLGVQFAVGVGTLVDGPNCYFKASGGQLHALWADDGDDYKPSTMNNVYFRYLPTGVIYSPVAATRATRHALWMLFKPDLTG